LQINQAIAEYVDWMTCMETC